MAYPFKTPHRPRPKGSESSGRKARVWIDRGLPLSKRLNGDNLEKNNPFVLDRTRCVAGHNPPEVQAFKKNNPFVLKIRAWNGKSHYFV